MHRRFSLMVGIMAASVVFSVVAAFAQGPEPAGVQVTLTSTGFRYQGQLKQNGVLVNGMCDFNFSLWDAAGSGTPPAGGNQIGASETWVNHPVSGGLFNASLATSPSGFNSGDNAFSGEDRWLQIAVRCPAGTGGYQSLSPRQRIYAAPYALALPGLRTQQHITNPMVVATNGISVPMNADGGKPIVIGERYRDNAIVAWGRVSAGGTLEREFGVASLAKGTAGVYTITLDVTAEGATALVPIVIAEVESLPTSAAGARHAFLNQVSANTFAVYITRGDWVADDNDFVFMVTAR